MYHTLPNCLKIVKYQTQGKQNYLNDLIFNTLCPFHPKQSYLVTHRRVVTVIQYVDSDSRVGDMHAVSGNDGQPVMTLGPWDTNSVGK